MVAWPEMECKRKRGWPFGAKTAVAARLGSRREKESVSRPGWMTEPDPGARDLRGSKFVTDRDQQAHVVCPEFFFDPSPSFQLTSFCTRQCCLLQWRACANRSHGPCARSVCSADNTEDVALGTECILRRHQRSNACLSYCYLPPGPLAQLDVFGPKRTKPSCWC